MRIRSDSPFHKITEEQKAYLLDQAEMEMSHDDIAEEWQADSGIETTGEQVKRFLRRLRYEAALRDADETSEGMEAFVDRAKDGKARDGLIEASRQKLFEGALADGNHELLLELYRSANEERAREREVAVAQRKAAVAEENARIGWRKLEVLAAGRTERKMVTAQVVATEQVVERTGETLLLAQIREAALDGGGSVEERLGRIREVLMGGEGRLLKEKAEG